MKIKFLLLISLALGLVGNSCTSEVSPETYENGPSADGGFEAKTARHIQENLSDWLTFYKLKITDFKIEHHEAAIGDAFPYYEYGDEPNPEIIGQKPEASETDLNPLLLVYSPDEHFYLDCHFYLRIYKNTSGAIIVEGTDPDASVELWDIKVGRAYRMRFCGPSCIYEDAYFLNKDFVVLAGFSEDFETNTGAVYPYLELVQVESGETWKYKYKEPVKSNTFNYVKQKVERLLKETETVK